MSTEPAPSHDPRVDAALAVLGGESVDTVAARTGLEPALVDRWVRQFVDGGAASIANAAPVDPSTRDRFLALLAHELRTPITVVAGWVETLQSQGRDIDPTMLAAALDAIGAHTRRLHRLADDLGDTAAVTLGRMRLHLATVDLAPIIASVVASFEGDRIAVDIDDTLLVEGDPDRLAQMVTAVIDDGMHRSGDPLALAASVSPDGRWAVIRLTVPGTPPPLEEMAALLEPFDRGTGDAHVGLGLYVTRSLAVAHGGQCGVDASDDALSFWIRIPCRPADASVSQ